MTESVGIWNELVRLAVEGYNAGSLGIAAAIADQDGAIMAKGRNQLSDSLDSCNKIKMTSIARGDECAQQSAARKAARSEFNTVHDC